MTNKAHDTSTPPLLPVIVVALVFSAMLIAIMFAMTSPMPGRIASAPTRDTSTATSADTSSTCGDTETHRVLRDHLPAAATTAFTSKTSKDC